MKTINRRVFLKSAAFTAAAFSLPSKGWSQALSASDEVRVAIVGFNGRGQDHIKGLSKEPGVRITGLCDVDQKLLDAEAQKHKDVETTTDLRRLLESKNIDAISIATPNHWHALASIWAIQAGKDVYVEKPVSHNVWEGRKIVEAARKYKRMVQAGMQSRSSQAIQESVDWVRQGNLGKIVVARALCYKPRRSIGKVNGPQPIPPGLDYDLWCGPAMKLPLMRSRLHYDWHWDFNTGCGDLGNQGIHQMDIARWFLGANELSPRVFSVGGRLGYDDDGNTPNTQLVFHDYPQAPLIFEVRGLPRGKEFANDKDWNSNMDKFPSDEKNKGGSVCVVIHCEGGYVLVPGYSGAVAYDKEGNVVKKWEGATSHFANFLKAVRSRKQTDLNGDILEGHLSSALCHTGNISYRLGFQKSPDEIREKIKGERGATDTFDRMTAHLGANGVELTKDKLVLGDVLTMDPQTEKFIGSTEGNALLTRHYRRPYVVPEQV